MNKKYIYLIVILLIISSLAAFGRIVENDFINFDDDKYITANNNIKSGINPESIKWAFSAVVASNWHPLTLISHTLDWSLFGANASGHHIVSLLLHIGAVLFLFFFLKKTTSNLWPAAFAAALFALHPLRVESVAWASERKDVLSMFFGMATLYAYAFYVENSRISRYFICLVLFALSLMSKPMLVTMPFVLLLLDYWPLGRWQQAWNPVHVTVGNDVTRIKKKGKRRKVDAAVEKKITQPLKDRKSLIGVILLEKAPFFMLAVLSIVLTLWAQRDAIDSLDKIPFADRVLNAVLSFLYYIIQLFYPVDLAVLYPFPNSFPLWQVSVAALLLLGISIAVIHTFKKAPFLFVGWFWYIGTLIPVIGLVKVGNQAMADRYTYLPSIGIIIMLAWGIPLLFRREEIRKNILCPAAIAILFVLAVLTWNQCGYWKNNITLFSHTLRVTKNNYLAHHDRGQAYAELGQYQLAIEDYNEAIRLKADSDSTYYDRGSLYVRHGQYQFAVEDFNKAIDINPHFIQAYNNRGIAYTLMGIYKKALEDFNEAIRLKPDHASAYNMRAFVYLSQGDNIFGCRDARESCELGICTTLNAAIDRGLCR